MKSYKEINAEFKVDETLKQQTIQNMVCPAPRHAAVWKKPVMYAGMAAVLVLLLTGGTHWMQDSDRKEEKGSLQSFGADQLSLDTYIVSLDDRNAKTSGAMDFTGTWEKMTEEEQTLYEQKFPALQKLSIPEGYRISASEFQMFYDKNETGYPDIHVGMTAENGEDGMVDLWIQDDRIPHCIVMEDKGKRYLDYQLLIQVNEQDLSYSAIAYKGGFRYEISSWMISKEAFYQLVASVLI